MPKTDFRPDSNGFAFINSWTFDTSENDEMNRSLNGGITGAIKSLSQPLAAVGGTTLTAMLNQWSTNAVPQRYGLCGGMAFASLDYYLAKKPLPRGKDINDLPKRQSPSGKILREYLWRRQLESMAANVPTMLTWMGFLHSVFPFTGPHWLLERSKEEWAKLKEHIKQGKPWPLCLVGSSTNPFHNHQVLAYGYDDPGNGTGTIYLYDMNCPNKEHTTHLDFRGQELVAKESCPSSERGALRGFFCEIYQPAPPPNVPTT